jgi:molybdopterin molybdotransferase
MADFTPQPSCADPLEAALMPMQVAQDHIQQLVSPLTASETCSLREALGRVLHQDIISPHNVPAHRNSAMDGYAIASSDLNLGNDSLALQQIGIAFAGKPHQGQVSPGQCIRIMTGAVVPAECDTIIMQEHVAVDGDTITIHGKQRAGQHIRQAGEDLAIGDTALKAGRKLIPADLGLIASLGIADVNVTRKLKVAFFSTGDELRSIGDTLEAGQIYDSNRYTLYGMLTRLDVELLDLGVIPDQRDALRGALKQAATEADVIITTGGVSVGDADYVKEMLAELGQVAFWKIAMKPGRPLAFGKIDQTLFFGLPGNPVSVMVTFYQFVLPALQQLTGEAITAPHTFQVRCHNHIRKRPGRYEFQRGILFTDDNGELGVKTTGQQGSGILHSMSIANCFILIDETCDGIAEGEWVKVQPFSGLV